MHLGLAQCFNIGVVDQLLAVGQDLEVLKHFLQLPIVKVIAQVADALAQGMPAAVLA